MNKYLFKFNGFHVVSKFIVKVITFDFAYAITIFPFVFYRNKYGRSNTLTRNEETIHIKQQMECGLVGTLIGIVLGSVFHSYTLLLLGTFIFVLLYVLFFLINFIKNFYRYFIKRDSGKSFFEVYWSYCYEKIPFEQEAAYNSNNNKYLTERKMFSWVRYIRGK